MSACRQEAYGNEACNVSITVKRGGRKDALKFQDLSFAINSRCHFQQNVFSKTYNRYDASTAGDQNLDPTPEYAVGMVGATSRGKR
jgi:hypothetical protein